MSPVAPEGVRENLSREKILESVKKRGNDRNLKESNIESLSIQRGKDRRSYRERALRVKRKGVSSVLYYEERRSTVFVLLHAQAEEYLCEINKLKGVHNEGNIESLRKKVIELMISDKKWTAEYLQHRERNESTHGNTKTKYSIHPSLILASKDQ